MNPQQQNQEYNQGNFPNQFSANPFSAPFFQQNGFPFQGQPNPQNQGQFQGNNFPTGFPFHGQYQMPFGNGQQSGQQPYAQQNPMNFKSLMDNADQLMKVMNKTGPMIKQLAPLFNMMKKL